MTAADDELLVWGLCLLVKARTQGKRDHQTLPHDRSQEGGLLVPLYPSERRKTPVTGYVAQKDHSARCDSCRNNGQEDRLAFLPTHPKATNLRAMGEDVKIAQERLRHSNSRTTMDITRKPYPLRNERLAAGSFETMLGSKAKGAGDQHRSAPSSTFGFSIVFVSCHNLMIL